MIETIPWASVQEFIQKDSETNVQRRNRWHGATFTSKSVDVMRYERHNEKHNTSMTWFDLSEMISL